MKRTCNCCHREQDTIYDPYYLFNGVLLCESCLLKRYPVHEVHCFYAPDADKYYDSTEEALQEASEESYPATEDDEGED